MARISTYSLDESVSGGDKWIGSDSGFYNKTKNFTPLKLADYFNSSEKIDSSNSLRFWYQTLDLLEERSIGTISFESEVGASVAFSGISSFLLSKNTEGIIYIYDFFNSLIESKILLHKADTINTYAIYEVTAIEEYEDNSEFIKVSVSFIRGNGGLLEDKSYLISVIDFALEASLNWGNIEGNLSDQTDLQEALDLKADISSLGAVAFSNDYNDLDNKPAIPTNTSDLINDGADGINPFITALDIPTLDLNDLSDVTISTPLDEQVLTYETATSLWKNKTLTGGVQLTRQEFTFTTSQDFTLSNTPSYIYSVFVNGQELNSSQYSNVTTTLTIVDTLDTGDKVNIVYSENAGGVLDYYTKSQIDAFNFEQDHVNFVEVNDLTDLPSEVSGVITLAAGYTYLFLKHIDLLGFRLVCGQDTVIVGWSSENCSITSTGLSASTALITSTYSLPIRNISFTHALVFDLQGDGTTTALDWFGVNLLNCASGGTIKNYTNFVAGDSALLNSGGFTFDGTIGTIAFSNCLFDVASTKTAITILSTCTISRRLRVIYSSFVVLSGETGINFSTSASVGDEKYILDTCNFSGGGTYTTGVTYTENKALFVSCVGITNTSTKGFMYMLNNNTDTTIGAGNANVWLKATGTTTAGTNSKFTHTTNRLTYNGAFVSSFLVTLNATVRSGGTNQNISIGVAKNGTIISESEGIIRTGTSNVEHGGSTQAVLEMASNDYIELFVRNTSTTNIRVTDFNFNVIKIPV